jgi:hypothetical protein
MELRTDRGNYPVTLAVPPEERVKPFVSMHEAEFDSATRTLQGFNQGKASLTLATDEVKRAPHSARTR